MITDQVIRDPSWIAGFTSAEGNFFVQNFSSPNSKLKERVKLEFCIVQHIRDEYLISKLLEYWDCGAIQLKSEIVAYRTSKFSDITKTIIPFFKEYTILGVKSKDF